MGWWRKEKGTRGNGSGWNNDMRWRGVSGKISTLGGRRREKILLLQTVFLETNHHTCSCLKSLLGLGRTTHPIHVCVSLKNWRKFLFLVSGPTAQQPANPKYLQLIEEILVTSPFGTNPLAVLHLGDEHPLFPMFQTTRHIICKLLGRQWGNYIFITTFSRQTSQDCNKKTLASLASNFNIFPFVEPPLFKSLRSLCSFLTALIRKYLFEQQFIWNRTIWSIKNEQIML